MNIAQTYHSGLREADDAQKAVDRKTVMDLDSHCSIREGGEQNEKTRIENFRFQSDKSRKALGARQVPPFTVWHRSRQGLTTLPGFCPFDMRCWPRLDPLAGRVAPVEHRTSSKICDGRAGTHGMARQLRDWRRPAKNTTRCRLNPAWPQNDWQKSSADATRRCEGRLSSVITRKLADPGLEGCAVKAQESVRKLVKEFDSAPANSCYGESLKPTMRADTKRVAPEQNKWSEIHSGRVLFARSRSILRVL